MKQLSTGTLIAIIVGSLVVGGAAAGASVYYWQQMSVENKVTETKKQGDQEIATLQEKIDKIENPSSDTTDTSGTVDTTGNQGGSATTVDTADWKTGGALSLHVELKYPSTWEQITQNTKDTDFVSLIGLRPNEANWKNDTLFTVVLESKMPKVGDTINSANNVVTKVTSETFKGESVSRVRIKNVAANKEYERLYATISGVVISLSQPTITKDYPFSDSYNATVSAILSTVSFKK